MRISSYAVARPTYYDRAPLTRSSQYSSTLAPHAYTARFTVTIAAGYKAYVENAYCLVISYTAATAASDCYSGVGTITDDVASSYVANAQILGITTGLSSINSSSSVALLNPGNQFIGFTANLNTGGTILHTISVKYTLFAS